jgi:hypothetical protein
MQQLTALSNTLRHGRQCPRIPVADLSTVSHLALFIKSSLALCVSSQLPTFDVAQTAGWTGREQNRDGFAGRAGLRDILKILSLQDMMNMMIFLQMRRMTK